MSMLEKKVDFVGIELVLLFCFMAKLDNQRVTMRVKLKVHNHSPESEANVCNLYVRAGVNQNS